MPENVFESEHGLIFLKFLKLLLELMNALEVQLSQEKTITPKLIEETF